MLVFIRNISLRTPYILFSFLNRTYRKLQRLFSRPKANIDPNEDYQKVLEAFYGSEEAATQAIERVKQKTTERILKKLQEFERN